MAPSLLDIATVVITIVATLVTIISLLFSLFIEKEKSSKFYSEVRTRLQAILGRLSNVPSAIIYGVRIILNALLLFSLAYFILFAPIFLYEEFRQPNHVVSSAIDRASIFYGLVIMVWCLSIMAVRHKLSIDKLHNQIDYLNRIPGIKELKQNYNRQLFDAVIRQWNDFGVELVTKHDESPFAIDLADCSPLDVQDENLIICCPNKAIHRRMNRKAPSSSTGHDEEYEAWKSDKESIEGIMKERFQVRQISYILEKQIQTKA
jgi:hypothetical protein